MRHSLPSQTYRYQYNLEVGHVGLAYVVEVCSVKCETLRGGDGTGRRVDGEKLLRDIGALHEHAVRQAVKRWLKPQALVQRVFSACSRRKHSPPQKGICVQQIRKQFIW